MPRQDVPYGGAICRLKERIAEIWDELGKKLHSINGVEGDAAGDVKIVSGDAAVVVTSDQVNHEIEIALDSSQLPAAAVSSVNGQTGAVVLDANDIDAGLTPPGTSVAQDLASTKQQLQVVGGLMQQEILDRQNADSTLQTNINVANASISGKVSKLTTAGDYAYTHSGSTDGEIALVDGTTASTIPIRDANGRMQAADPANGATDKTLTTANWISQSGMTKPNNVIHNNGIEDFKNDKSFGTAATPDVASLLLWASGAYRRLRMRSSTDDYTTTPASNIVYGLFNYSDKNDQTACNIQLTHKSTGGYKLEAVIRTQGGGFTVFVLGETS